MEMASEQFLEAAKKGDLDLVRDMLHAGKVHVDVADINGNTALIAAAVRPSVTFSWVKSVITPTESEGHRMKSGNFANLPIELTLSDGMCH